MPTMRAVQVTSADGPFELVERALPTPARGQVRIRIQACGVCHSDAFTKTGAFPGIRYPRVPGHEVVGIIDQVGEAVPNWRAGQRVGVGWHGGHCGHCPSCRRGDFITCANAQIPGISYDGGYADAMIAPFEALAAIPDELQAAEAAPLLCAGITTYNALRHSGARPGDLVAVLGIGGLGHLGVQFAARMGCRTVAIARGAGKGAAGTPARRPSRHRQPGAGRAGRAPRARRRAGDPLDGHQLPGDERRRRRARRGRQDDRGRRRGRADRDRAAPADRRAPLASGLALGHLERFRRHLGLQRVGRHPTDDRDHAAGACGGCLRTDDERPAGSAC